MNLSETAAYLTSSPFFGITLSILCYELGCAVNRRLKTPVANPLLIAVVLVILLLKALKIPYEGYNQGGAVISMLLAPATASLAVNIYSQLERLKQQLLPILAGAAAGTVASVGCIVLLCKAFGLDRTLTVSLVPKSVTTPIAMGISEQLGGVVPVTVAAVVVTGILGAAFAPVLIKVFRIKDPVAAGLGIGACSHALGPSKALEIGEIEGAMSGIAIGVVGLFTVILAPLFV